ncbi:MAG: ABC transporter permease [Gemmatimonas sp.]
MAAVDAGSPVGVRQTGPRRSLLSNVSCTLLLLIMGLMVLYPLLLLVYGSLALEEVDGTKSLGFDMWITAWQQPGMVQAVTNTFKRVFFTEIFAVPAAVIIAWLVARTDIPGKKLIDTFFWIALFLPSLPVVLGWILLFDPDYGAVNKFFMTELGFSGPPLDIYSFSGIIFAHLASRSIAAKYIFLVPAFRNFDASLEEASVIAGSGPLATVWRIVIPILMPAVLITIAISLTHSLESFEIELVLGPPTSFYVFSTKMYALIHDNPPMFGAATVLGLSILVVILPLIVWQQRLIGTRSYVTVTSHFQARVLRLRRLRWPVFGVIAGLGLIITLTPVTCLVIGTFMNLFGHFELSKVWTTAHWSNVLGDPVLLHALSNTMILALSASFVGVIWFALVAYISVRTRYPGRKALDFVTWLPATLPGIILGLGLLWMFLTVPIFKPLYGTIVVLIIAVMINSVTTGVQLIKSNMVQIGYELEEASFVSGASWVYTFRRIVLPVLGPALITVALLTFNSAARNISNIAMIVTGDNRPLSMLQVDYMTDGQYESAAIVGVIIVLLTLGVAMGARAVSRRFGFRTA